MSLSLHEFGLQEQSIYNGSEVKVKHKDKEDWFPLIRTTKKTVIYSEGGNERKMTLKKLESVSGDLENFSPQSQEKPEPEKSELALGLLTNTNYEGSGVMVEHIDKEGMFPLISTSNKVIWYKEDGQKRKMTLNKLSAVQFPDSEEQEEPKYSSYEDQESEFKMDCFFDNDFVMASDPSLVMDNDRMYE